MKKFSLYAGVAAGVLLTGCLFQGQDTADSSQKASAQFQIQARSSGGGAFLSDLAGNQFTVTEARAYVTRVEVKSTRGGDSSDELSLRGHFAVNLLTGASTPDMGTLVIPAGTYREIEIKLSKAKPEDGVLAAGDELLGHSLMVKGTFGMAGAAPKPFSLVLDMDEKIEIENDSGIKLDASSLQTVLVSLNTREWLKDLDLEGCATADSNGIVALGECIDAGKVEDNVKHSCEVERREGGRHGDDGMDTTRDDHSGRDGDSDRIGDDKGGHGGNDSGRVGEGGHEGNHDADSSPDGHDSTRVGDDSEGRDSSRVGDDREGHDSSSVGEGRDSTGVDTAGGDRGGHGDGAVDSTGDGHEIGAVDSIKDGHGGSGSGDGRDSTTVADGSNSGSGSGHGESGEGVEATEPLEPGADAGSGTK
jgi:hypothetical protein